MLAWRDTSLVLPHPPPGHMDNFPPGLITTISFRLIAVIPIWNKIPIQIYREIPIWTEITIFLPWDTDMKEIPICFAVRYQMRYPYELPWDTDMKEIPICFAVRYRYGIPIWVTVRYRYEMRYRYVLRDNDMSYREIPIWYEIPMMAMTLTMMIMMTIMMLIAMTTYSYMHIELSIKIRTQSE